jgi:hypothetical protein
MRRAIAGALAALTLLAGNTAGAGVALAAPAQSASQTQPLMTPPQQHLAAITQQDDWVSWIGLDDVVVGGPGKAGEITVFMVFSSPRDIGGQQAKEIVMRMRTDCDKRMVSLQAMSLFGADGELLVNVGPSPARSADGGAGGTVYIFDVACGKPVDSSLQQVNGADEARVATLRILGSKT